ncbi:MAG: hypothetical protein ACF8R7_01075 [Phycisphaerales bacterium JB039]
MRWPHLAMFALALLCLFASVASAQPRWSRQFVRVSMEQSQIRVLLAGDIGGGERLWIGGDFTAVDEFPAAPVIEWDGETWRALPGLVGTVHALAIFDDGAGPALYAGGAFGPPSGVARWTGAGWVALEGGGVAGVVSALTVWDDGAGPALYAGGEFASAGGSAARNLARWDGTAWAALGDGVDGPAHALRGFDGGDDKLYIGGAFSAGSANVTRWDGGGFEAVGAGADGPVHALEVFDDGTGARMFAGGSFTAPGSYLASWDGSAWRAEAPLSHPVEGLCVAPVDGREVLAIGRHTTSSEFRPISLWDGRQLVDTPIFERYPVRALAVFDDGSGPALHAGDQTTTCCWSRVQRLDADRWNEIGDGVSPWDPGAIIDPHIRTLAMAPTPEGDRLIVGGSFVVGSPYTPPTLATAIAAWDGAGWSDFNGELPGPGCADCERTTLSITVASLMGVARTYVMGAFSIAGARHVVLQSDDGAWAPLPEFLRACTGCFFVNWGDSIAFDDGRGPAVFFTGAIEMAGPQAALGIARWDGAQWSTLGSGLRMLDETRGEGHALVIFDDGTGPALYAAGEFARAGDVLASNIARWDGADWSALGAGLDAPAHALAVFDDGRGPALYAGGAFSKAGALQRASSRAGTGWSGPRSEHWRSATCLRSRPSMTVGGRRSLRARARSSGGMARHGAPWMAG